MFCPILTAARVTQYTRTFDEEMKIPCDADCALFDREKLCAFRGLHEFPDLQRKVGAVSAALFRMGGGGFRRKKKTGPPSSKQADVPF